MILRSFLYVCLIGCSFTLAATSPLLEPTKAGDLQIKSSNDAVEFRSAHLRLVASKREPRITQLCFDSAGAKKVDENLLKVDPAGGISVTLPFTDVLHAEQDGNVVRYVGAKCEWAVRVEPNAFVIATSNTAKVKLSFAVEKTPVTPLANPLDKMAPAPLPLLIHAPDFGTLLVRPAESLARLEAKPLRPEPRCDYTIALGWVDKLRFEVVSAKMPLPLLAQDPRLANWSRYGLNAFQYRADLGMLANNIVSDNVIFCLQMYGDVAAFTPPVAGVEPMRMVRESLDRYFAGQAGYGAAWADLMTDVHPAAIIAAWDIVRTTGDTELLLPRWLPELERRAGEVMASDRDHNGLPESKRTGLRGTAQCPTSNWWDQVNFGHEDAYGCALAYRAFRCMADLERLAKREEQAKRYDTFADGIRTAYLPNFFNPKTGVLAGWKDAKGELHDYWFTFVTGCAITNGLIPADRANEMIDRIQAKMKEVGFTRFDLGLPGNLIPILKDDYGKGALGSPQKDDGTDTFGVFENGGASACFAYYYVQALYQLGRRDEADAILWPMLKTYGEGGFQNGVGKGGEWRHWDGKPSGYEGFLPDAWFSLLALFNGHQGVILTPEGFTVAPWAKSKDKVALTGLRFMGQVVESTR